MACIMCMALNLVQHKRELYGSFVQARTCGRCITMLTVHQHSHAFECIMKQLMVSRRLHLLSGHCRYVEKKVNLDVHARYMSCVACMCQLDSCGCGRVEQL